jgi:hypothetical protein
MCKYQRSLKFQHEALIILSLTKDSTDNHSFDTALEITATEEHFETTTMELKIYGKSAYYKMWCQELRNFLKIREPLPPQLRH